MQRIKSAERFMVVLALPLVGWIAWIRSIQARTDALRAEAGRLEADFAAVSARYLEAQSLEPRFELALKQTTLASNEIASNGWTPALSAMVDGVATGVELREVHIGKDRKNPKMLTAHLRGVANGTIPRVIADDFRTALHRELSRRFRGEVSVSFERLDEETDSNSPLRAGVATFEIAATIWLEPAGFGRAPGT